MGGFGAFNFDFDMDEILRLQEEEEQQAAGGRFCGTRSTD
jgi:hypothetical protein